MNNPYQSPEKARQSPEIKGGAAYAAKDRVETISLAVRFVLDATKPYIESSKEIPRDAAYPAAKVEDDTDGLEQSNTMATEATLPVDVSKDLQMDAAYAALAAAYNNPEETN